MGVRRLAVANGPNIFQMLLVYLIFISSVTVRIRIKVRILGLGLGYLFPTCRANLVLRVIWQCDIFGKYILQYIITRPSAETVLEHSRRRFCLQRADAYSPLEVPQLYKNSYYITSGDERQKFLQVPLHTNQTINRLI